MCVCVCLIRQGRSCHHAFTFLATLSFGTLQALLLLPPLTLTATAARSILKKAGAEEADARCCSFAQSAQFRLALAQERVNFRLPFFEIARKGKVQIKSTHRAPVPFFNACSSTHTHTQKCCNRAGRFCTGTHTHTHTHAPRPALSLDLLRFSFSPSRTGVGSSTSRFLFRSRLAQPLHHVRPRENSANGVSFFLSELSSSSLH